MLVETLQTFCGRCRSDIRGDWDVNWSSSSFHLHRTCSSCLLGDCYL